jgi:protein SCO1/2
MIREPDKLFSEGDPVVLALSAKFKQVRMPNLGVSEAEAAALIDYIGEQSRRVSPNAITIRRR